MDNIALAFEIITLLNDSGKANYLVGGTVRDYLLEREIFDIDIASQALPRVNMELIKNCDSLNKDGFYYGVLKYVINGIEVDITTLRKETQYCKNRRPQKVEFIEDIMEDAKRRDFTINALYLDMNGKIHDFYDGLTHLKQKRIVMIGEIETRMNEDALRILRAIRLALKLSFSLDEGLEQFIIANNSLLANLKKSAINREIEKIKSECDINEALILFKKLGLEQYLEEKL